MAHGKNDFIPMIKKELQKKRFFMLASLLGATTTVFALFILWHTPALSLFPDNRTYFEFATITDADLAEGNSTAELQQTDTSLTLTYTLDTSAQKPFAMLVFHDLDLVRNYDISPYDSLHFHLSTEHSANFSVTLYMYIPGFSDPALSDTHRPYRYDIRLKGGENEITIPLDKFATPSWWFTRYKTTEEQLPPTNWAKFTHMTISSHPREGSGRKLSLSFNDIVFTQSTTRLFLLMPLFLVLILILMGFFTLFSKYLLRSSSTKKSIPTPFSRKTSSDDEQKLNSYLLTHYTNPLLSLDTIKKECQLNHFQVQQILKEKYNTSFKEYLITLRLNKAKELLTQSSLPIGVIAEEVGYVYANSFSRAFKQVQNSTPLQYRKRFSENNS